MRFLIALFLAVVGFSAMPAYGQQYAAKYYFTDASINTLSTTSATVLAVDNNRRYLLIHNPNVTYTVACALASATAVVNGLASFNLAPGATIEFRGPVPQNAFNCISANAAATKLTIWVGN